MRRTLAIMATLFLSGCGALKATYTPDPLEVYDEPQYQADVQSCADHAANYKPHFDSGDVLASGAKGAVSNASGAVVGGVAVPIAGALGSASSAAITDLDIMGKASANVNRHCLNDKTTNDHSAIMAKPED